MVPCVTCFEACPVDRCCIDWGFPFVIPTELTQRHYSSAVEIHGSLGGTDVAM